MSVQVSGDDYTHGHADAVLRSHRWRTAQNSASYLLARLRPGMRLLDVGCGPGTLTVDLGRHVPGGEVVGVDREAAVVSEAASLEGANTRFVVGDVYALDFDDASFDVVHGHQVLQHLTDPVRALREMRRVCKPGGLVAVRDSDYAGFTWHPAVPELERWLSIYHRVAQGNGAEPDAGRRLLEWGMAAGFGAADLTPSASVWCFATPDERAWWADLWADRITITKLADTAVDRGLATRDELASIGTAWRSWATQPNAWFSVLHGELVGRVS